MNGRWSEKCLGEEKAGRGGDRHSDLRINILSKNISRGHCPVCFPGSRKQFAYLTRRSLEEASWEEALIGWLS